MTRIIQYMTAQITAIYCHAKTNNFVKTEMVTNVFTLDVSCDAVYKSFIAFSGFFHSF